MGIEKIDEQLCIGCGDCVANCPMDILRMDESGIARITYPADCMDCYVCEESCPVKAIEVSPESKRKIWFSYEIGETGTH